jgi:hypothetical protein
VNVFGVALCENITVKKTEKYKLGVKIRKIKK